jgi:hypothetical protein
VSLPFPAAVTDEPITSATVADWEAAEAYLATQTSHRARNLDALTVLMGDEFHHLVLDPQTSTIWWAWDREPNAPTDEAGWSVDQLTATAAAEMLDGYVDLIEDRFADPEQYRYGNDLDNDQDAMDEYTDILLLTLPDAPTDAAARIRRKRELIARADARWQRAEAALARELTDTVEDDQRRADLSAAVKEARGDRGER